MARPNSPDYAAEAYFKRYRLVYIYDLCIFVNTNGGNIIRMCHSETRRDYLIIKLVIVYRWYENLPLKETKSFLFLFFHKLIRDNIISFFPSKKKKVSRHIFLCMSLRKQGYHVTNFARKTKVSSYKKIKLSRLLVQRINEIKYRQETTQNVLTVLHNTLHYLRLSH